MPGGWSDAASGATQGASVGSFIPGVGTLVGAGVGGLLGWLAGSRGNKDKNKDRPETPYLQSLEDAGQRARAQGDAFGNQSSEALAPVLEHFRNLMGSDPNAVLDATRQERGRVLDQYDTARRAIAHFGPRGGGTTSALAESRFAQAESLADITSTARRDAVGNAAQLGTVLASLGLSAQQLESMDLNAIINAIFAREGIETEKRGQNMQAVGGAAEAAGSLLGLYLTRKGGAWERA